MTEVPSVAQGLVDFIKQQREAWLCQVDGAERLLKITPRTAELRKMYKEGKLKSYEHAQPERSASDGQ